MNQPNTYSQANRPEHGPLFSKLQLPAPKAHVIFWSLLVLGVGADLWSKHAVFKWLGTRNHNQFPVIKGFVTLVMRENSGAAFSLFTGWTSVLIAVSIIALCVVVAFFLLGNIRQKIAHIALALFAAGIIGNLYDRIFNNGFVRDFIDVVYWPGKHWPAFNVADAMLCVAVGLLLIGNITSAYSRKPAHPQK